MPAAVLGRLFEPECLLTSIEFYLLGDVVWWLKKALVMDRVKILRWNFVVNT